MYVHPADAVQRGLRQAEQTVTRIIITIIDIIITTTTTAAIITTTTTTTTTTAHGGLRQAAQEEAGAPQLIFIHIHQLFRILYTPF